MALQSKRIINCKGEFMENIYKNIVRFTPSTSEGLNKETVALRYSQNLSNTNTSVSSRSFADIFKANLFTLFNFINLILALALVSTGSYKNLMFMGVVICNCVIGIIQEIRAKKATDKLKLINETSVTVVRDGKEVKIKPEEIVLDDIIKYSQGSQISTDSLLLKGFCEVNEALLTGESDLILKQKGDILFSGSFIASGSCYAKAEHVGNENYTSKIYNGAKYVKENSSEIMRFLKNLIKIISIAIVPIGLLLFFNQLRIFSYDLTPTIVGTCSALIGMIPEGLVLLTSTALALSIVRLSKHNVLVQDLYCIETLARTDTLCLDKTGTITEGILEVVDFIPQNGFDKNYVELIMNTITSVLNDSNETFKALKAKFNSSKSSLLNLTVKEIVPFSSVRKWSGVSFEEKGSYIIGASEFVFKEIAPNLKETIQKFSKDYRVMVLAKSKNYFNAYSNGRTTEKSLPEELTLVSIILISDKIKKSAKSTFEFFNKKGVDIKVISGDNPITVANIAEKVGIKNASSYIDMATIKNNNDLNNAAQKYTVFGRVSPTQKKDLIKALQKQGHTVAMTGDGINDILALKEADCSIAMANGSDASRTISQIVLLNSEFSSLTKIVAEGQRVINNIQRVSTLFLVKTIYSFSLAVLFLLIRAPYPFIPIQMTLISALTIGIPSFFLALEPNEERIKNSFIKNILKRSLPTAITIIINVVFSIFLYKFFGLSRTQYSTLCVALTGILELGLIYEISLPLNFRRKLLIFSISILFFFSIIFFKDLFSLADLTLNLILIFLILFLISHFVFKYLTKKIISKFIK